MKRSEINRILKDAEAFLSEKRFLLPDWSKWGVEEWKENKDKVRYIRERMLGWDITDFGSGILHVAAFSCSAFATADSASTGSLMPRR